MLLLNKRKLFIKVADEFRNEDKSKCNSCVIIVSILGGLGIIFSFFFFFIAATNFINSEDYYIFIASCIQIISYIFPLIGVTGKLVCCCLYNPYQWFFFMVIINLIAIIINLFLMSFIFTNKKLIIINDSIGYAFWGFFFNIIFIIYCFVRHGLIFSKLKDLFNEIRLIETDLAKYCVLEYIKELKSTQHSIGIKFE